MADRRLSSIVWRRLCRRHSEFRWGILPYSVRPARLAEEVALGRSHRCTSPNLAAAGGTDYFQDRSLAALSSAIFLVSALHPLQTLERAALHVMISAKHGGGSGGREARGYRCSP